MSQAAHGAGTPNRQARTHGSENYILTRVFAHDFDARPMIQWGRLTGLPRNRAHRSRASCLQHIVMYMILCYSVNCIAGLSPR